MYKETSSLASKDRNFQQTLRAISFVELTNNNTLAIVTTHVQNNAPNLMDLIFIFFLGCAFSVIDKYFKTMPTFFLDRNWDIFEVYLLLVKYLTNAIFCDNQL